MMALSPRERQAADLRAEGLTVQEIADRMRVSRKLAEWYLCCACSKLGVRADLLPKARAILAGMALLVAFAMPARAHHHHISNLFRRRPAMERNVKGELVLHDRTVGHDDHVYDEESWRRYLQWVRFQDHPAFSQRAEDATSQELDGYYRWRHSPQGQEPPTPFKGRAR